MSVIASGLDYEKASAHIIEVRASSGTLVSEDILTVTITVVNVLESIVLLDADMVEANTITEGAVSGTAVAGLRLQAVDEGMTDVSPAAQWSILQGSTQFTVSTTGRITYTAPATVDYETIPSYTIVVAATVSRDGVTVSDDLTITVDVVNVLESIVLSDADGALNTITENVVSGTAVAGLRLQAVDEGGSDVSPAVQWSLLQGSTSFVINATGMIRLAALATVDYETTPSYNDSGIGYGKPRRSDGER